MNTIKTYFAVDLGATSGRTMLARFDGEKISMDEISRFPNYMIPVGGHLYWDLPALYNEILLALKKVAESGEKIESIGIDTWGCDFAFFGKDGQLLGLPHCYRDAHTDGALERYFEKHDRKHLYDTTGIQFMPFNSLFQLDTLRKNGSTALENADKILFIPDALGYMLTGEAVCEYTVASTSQMMDPHSRKLSAQVLESVGLDNSRFGREVQPGTIIGTLSKQVRDFTGLGAIDVVAVAGHDTASAVVSVPAKGSNYAYLSCGTWSLMGIESPQPVINDISYRENFTNEGGVDGTTRILKNICGLWLLEQCRSEWKDAPSDIGELVALCETTDFASLIKPDDPSFAHPDSMTGAISDFCRKTGQAVPQTPAEYVRCIFRSLAHRYSEVLSILGSLSRYPIESLHVIGGGARNAYLMQFTADEIGIPVICGPAEGTALGNVLMQLRVAGELHNLTEMRKISANSTTLKQYEPRKKC